MATGFQSTIDCADPGTLSRFWQSALGYKPADPPEGSDTWAEWLDKMEVPKEGGIQGRSPTTRSSIPMGVGRGSGSNVFPSPRA